MQSINLDAARADGVLHEEVLRATPGYHPEAARCAGSPVVVIECAQNIPCNPCETVCPKHAIAVGEPITSLPSAAPERCIGCGICVAACPGLAVFLVGMDEVAGTATVTFAYEYLPVPVPGQRIGAVDRGGRVVCEGEVTGVVSVPSYDMTRVVTVRVPAEYADTVRGIERSKEG